MQSVHTKTFLVTTSALEAFWYVFQELSSMILGFGCNVPTNLIMWLGMRTPTILEQEHVPSPSVQCLCCP